MAHRIESADRRDSILASGIRWAADRLRETTDEHDPTDEVTEFSLRVTIRGWSRKAYDEDAQAAQAFTSLWDAMPEPHIGETRAEYADRLLAEQSVAPARSQAEEGLRRARPDATPHLRAMYDLLRTTGPTDEMTTDILEGLAVRRSVEALGFGPAAEAMQREILRIAPLPYVGETRGEYAIRLDADAKSASSPVFAQAAEDYRRALAALAARDHRDVL